MQEALENLGAIFLEDIGIIAGTEQRTNITVRNQKAWITGMEYEQVSMKKLDMKYKY